MEVVFENFPYEAARFFRRIIEFGFVTGALFCVPTSYVLYSTWDSTHTCNTSLRMWLLLRLFVFFAQAPFRAAMYIRLSAAIDPRDRARTVRQLIELCRSTSWRLNQYIGAFVYSWFLAAFFLIYHHRSLCSDNILYLTFFGNVILFIIHMGVSWMWMRRIFHVDPFIPTGEAPVSAELIAERTRLIVVDAAPEAARDMCSICLTDYEAGASVRQLPCKHGYHPGCIDPWLRQRGSCPLCQRTLADAPVLTGPNVPHEHQHPVPAEPEPAPHVMPQPPPPPPGVVVDEDGAGAAAQAGLAAVRSQQQHLHDD